MGATTGIEWTDRTWNPLTGCTKVSPGCDHCYAKTMHERFNGPGSFDTITLHPERLTQPLRWRKPARVFVNSMSDLFHQDVPDEYIARVFAVMAQTPQHTYQILSKRHGRMRSLLASGRWPELLVDAPEWPRELPGGWPQIDVDPERPLPNVWLGVSVENQQWADIRIPALLDTPAAVRFLSCEPLLGPVDLPWLADHYPWNYTEFGVECVCGAAIIDAQDRCNGNRIDWVIVGGESGPGARPMNPEWARSLRDQCTAAGVPFLFKQWGEFDGYGVRLGKKLAGRELDGRTWDEYPAVTE